MRWPSWQVVGPRPLVALVSVVLAVALSWSTTPAMAAPPNPSDAEIAGAQQQQQLAAADVGRLTAEVASAQAQLEQANAAAAAAADAQLIAEAELVRAQESAEVAATELAAATSAAEAARIAVGDLGAQTYMRGSDLGGLSALLSADGPSQLLQQVATLEYLAADRVAVLTELEAAQLRQADAAALADAAVGERLAAEVSAAASAATATQEAVRAQASTSQLEAEQEGLQQQLQDAQIRLLELQGQRDGYAAWVAQQQAQQQAASSQAAAAAAALATQAQNANRPATTGSGAPTSRPSSSAGGGATTAPGGGGVAPTSGRFTSCYEMRWGQMHNGLDIAAPIGTPIYAPIAGRVVRAGEATGFGLAVYIQHDDGSVTVYGHINDYFVTTGQRVTAGQLIAEVGNRGQSTGPHLHFEVHGQGMYQGRTNPMPWLRARGIEMGGPCS